MCKVLKVLVFVCDTLPINVLSMLIMMVMVVSCLFIIPSVCVRTNLCLPCAQDILPSRVKRIMCLLDLTFSRDCCQSAASSAVLCHEVSNYSTGLCISNIHCCL